MGYNPDIIFTSYDSAFMLNSISEDILNDDRLQEVNAVKNHRVVDVTADFVDRSGPRLINGLEEISEYFSS